MRHYLEYNVVATTLEPAHLKPVEKVQMRVIGLVHAWDEYEGLWSATPCSKRYKPKSMKMARYED